MKIPIVDFARWHQPGSTTIDRQAVANDLVNACRKVGFAYIINHEVPPERVNGVFDYMHKFFALKEEEKSLAPHPPGHEVHRGWSYPGLEKYPDGGRDVQHCRETYDIGSDDCTVQPNVWLPESILPGFRPYMTSFYEECGAAARSVIAALALGLGLPESEQQQLLQFHSGLNNQLRLAHYPRVSADELASGDTVRIHTHRDGSSITLLFQDDCGGLKVADPDEEEKLVDAPPIPNSMIINIGDMLMRWSNDTLKSNLHRVDLPPLEDRVTGTGRMTRERFSIPYFVVADDDAVVTCLSSCASEEMPAKYPTVTVEEYRLSYMKGAYEQNKSTVVSAAA